jgi:hypothetical protein
MTEYRRIHIPGATWFFNVNLAERKGNRLLVGHTDVLRQAFIKVRQNHRFQIETSVARTERSGVRDDRRNEFPATILFGLTVHPSARGDKAAPMRWTQALSFKKHTHKSCKRK